MDEVSFTVDKDQQIEDLQHELLMLQKKNELLQSNQSSDKSELIVKITQLEQGNDDKDFEIKVLKEQAVLKDDQLAKIQAEYEELSNKFTEQVKDGAKQLEALRKSQTAKLESKKAQSDSQDVALLKKDLEMQKILVKNAQKDLEVKDQQIKDMQISTQNEAKHIKTKM